MDKNTLQMGALGFTLLSFVVAFMMLDGMMNSAQASLTILPASLVMLVQAARFQRAIGKVAA